MYYKLQLTSLLLSWHLSTTRYCSVIPHSTCQTLRLHSELCSGQCLKMDAVLLLIIRIAIVHLSTTGNQLRSHITKDLSKDMLAAGMAVAAHEVEVHCKITKSYWYNQLRKRAVSALEAMTDEQIEKGIAELEKTKLSGVGMEEELQIIEYHTVGVGRPPSRKKKF